MPDTLSSLGLPTVSEGVTLTQMDVSTVILPMIDRMIAPVAQRLDKMDGKLDAAIALSAQMHSMEAVSTSMNARLVILEAKDSTRDLAVVEIKTVTRVLGVIGIPVLIALTLGGIASLFHIQLPSMDARPPAAQVQVNR